MVVVAMCPPRRASAARRSAPAPVPQAGRWDLYDLRAAVFKVLKKLLHVCSIFPLASSDITKRSFPVLDLASAGTYSTDTVVSLPTLL